MAAWQRGEGIGAFVEVDAQGSMRRASNASWDMSAYRPRMPEYDAVTWVGIGLAVFANLLIAVSLNIQKFAHNRNEALGVARQPYHKIPLWWGGMAINAVGEVGNLVAYGYAEATVVTPIGAVGVIFSAILATYVLKEKFARIHAVGILCIVAGVVLIVYSKGNEKVIEPTVEEAIHEYFLTTQSVCYLIIITVAGGFLRVACQQYGDQYVILYTSLCSLIAAWTVLGSKAFMAFFRLTVEKGQDQLTRFPAAFFAWGMLIIVILAAVASLHFLQMAMMHHENNKVIPTYYATFTLSCIIGAAVVYREFEGLSAGSLMLFFLGLALSGLGVFVLSTKEELPDESRDDDAESGGVREACVNGSARVLRSKWGRNGEGLRLIEMDQLAMSQQDAGETIDASSLSPHPHNAFSAVGIQEGAADGGVGDTCVTPRKSHSQDAPEAPMSANSAVPLMAAENGVKPRLNGHGV